MIMKGRIKWWNFNDGYGFIEQNENDNTFVYLKNFTKDNPNIFKIEEGQENEYDLEEKNSTKYIFNLKK